jgi:hypothetical protein
MIENIVKKVRQVYLSGSKTKAAIARELASEHPDLKKSDILYIYKQALDMGQAGANTYYDKYGKLKNITTSETSKREDGKSIAERLSTHSEVRLSQQKRDDFLLDQEPLINFMCRSWDNFERFKFENFSRKTNRKSHDEATSTYGSLKAAFEDYIWDSGDFSTSTRLLIKYRGELKSNIDASNSNDVFISICDILRWGGVLTVAIAGKFLDKHHANELLPYMQWIESSLPFDASSISLSVFDDAPSLLLSDSGATKVYSVLGNQCIIYDDRVAASLCYIISQFYDGMELPQSIRLVTGASGSSANKYKGNRNASSLTHKFSTKSLDKLPHAESNIKANWLIFRMVEQMLATNNEFCELVDAQCKKTKFNNRIWIAMRIVETALFMAGHTVPWRK